MAIEIFNKLLTGSFVPSAAFLITTSEPVLVWEITVGTGPANVEWYLEFGASPTGQFYREVAEEDAGGGATAMPKVVRTFKEEGGGGLATGSHFLDTEFRRKQQYARVQVRVTAGAAVRAKVTAPFGT